MFEDLSNPNAILSKQATECEQAQDYAGAAEIYKQIHTNRPSDSYAASRYIHCLRKLRKSQEAMDFGWSLSKELRANQYVHNAWAWAIYDYYFKTSENKEDDEADHIKSTSQDEATFKKMQNAAEYILKNSPETDTLIRTKIVFGICREAKQRGKWQIVYKFANQLDPAQLTKEPYQQGRMSDQERWFYSMIKALFEMGQNEGCQKLAQQGAENYPSNKHFRWWNAVTKARMGHQEEALTELQNLDKQYQEWFIREDIAKICEQLQRTDDAWIWYCKAASLQGPIKGRYKMIGHMSVPLQQLGRNQEAYEHLRLAHLLAEREGWDKAKTAQELREQMELLQSGDTTQITPQTYTPQDGYQLQRKLQNLWRDEIAGTLPHRQGFIKTVNEEKQFGFIRSDTDDFHFSFRDLPRNTSPTPSMQVEFDVEESYDRKKQRNSFKAIHIRLI
ncbi:cold shock domain-containing protein [Ktedonobacter robiniae]|uniref:CSD domain-containing protein n=1 Tax=Ktedonobacter robiniae TaxID=2778365 RepID=A0ABQ3UUE0_9CHLR|nr:cold shock domain-containing protein [Ktedonobacter robiniae]GHO56045.1 hypothetical protein KSB_45200 [Ktedonobacter robiniae]